MVDMVGGVTSGTCAIGKLDAAIGCMEGGEGEEEDRKEKGIQGGGVPLIVHEYIC